jgi:hypothetical protein
MIVEPGSQYCALSWVTALRQQGAVLDLMHRDSRNEQHWINAFNRLPQIRSELSQSTTNASRTAT